MIWVVLPIGATVFSLNLWLITVVDAQHDQACGSLVTLLFGPTTQHHKLIQSSVYRYKNVYQIFV